MAFQRGAWLGQHVPIFLRDTVSVPASKAFSTHRNERRWVKFHFKTLQASGA
jgi:hypothetical protein